MMGLMDEWDFGVADPNAAPDAFGLGDTTYGSPTPAQYDWMGNTFDTQLDSGINYVFGTAGFSGDPYSPYENASGYVMGGTKDPAGGPDSGGWINKMIAWFGEGKDQTKAATVTLAGSFLSGMFGARSKERLIKAQEKTADAAASNAAVNAEKLNRASSIAQTNAGSSMPKPVFSNKLAARQKRAGYGVS